MNPLVIHTLRNRYRLRGGEPNKVRDRLEHVLGEVLDEGLEAALAQVALPADEHICVRRVRAPVQLSAGQPDARLALDWSLALAAAIELSIASGGPAVVRYRSRRHALIDFALSVAAGDLSRAWAWRQVGVAPAGAAMSLESAERALIDALEGDGVAIVAVLVALASRARLAALSARWTTPDWRRLARAALAAHGLPGQLAEDSSAGSTETSAGQVAPALPAPLTARLHRALQRSALAPFVGTRKAEQRRARTCLALLAGDPALLPAAGDSAGALLVSALGSPAEAQRASEQSHPRPQGREGVRRARDRAAWTSDVPAQRQSQPHLPSAHSQADRAEMADDVVPAATTDRPKHSSVTGTRDSIRDGRDAALPDATLDTRLPEAAEPSQAPHLDEAQPLEDLRKRGHTQWGGLLFLLWLIEPAAIQDVAAQPPLGWRALRWVLHQLALRLAPAAPDDPAALAFAGLPPGAAPPALEDPPATAEEEVAIADCTGRIVAALRMRLGSSDDTDAQLLRQVCERRGEIVAEPGWIELHLAADQVSTSIRRCGLDLNPDFLPWLGVVVRFLYV